MQIRDHEEMISFYVSNLASYDIFLGLDWFKVHDPQIRWRDEEIEFLHCPDTCIVPKTPGTINALGDRIELPDYIQEFEKVFDKDTYNGLPPSHPWDHPIDLKESVEGLPGKCYPMSRDEKLELDKWLNENLQAGKIRPSNSPFATPVFFRKKADGSLRTIHDYR
jgi:hypothetical protein